MTRTRHNMHDPTPDPYPDEPVGDRTDDEVYRNDDARFAGDDRPDHDEPSRWSPAGMAAAARARLLADREGAR